jgi:hypothetical protein
MSGLTKSSSLNPQRLAGNNLSGLGKQVRCHQACCDFYNPEPQTKQLFLMRESTDRFPIHDWLVKAKNWAYWEMSGRDSSTFSLGTLPWSCGI